MSVLENKLLVETEQNAVTIVHLTTILVRKGSETNKTSKTCYLWGRCSSSHESWPKNPFRKNMNKVQDIHALEDAILNPWL